MSVQKLAQRKLRTAIVAANRSVWISYCEACLFLETGGAAVQSHLDVAVHGRKGLFMMSECKRILNKEVAGEGLWQTDLSKCQEQHAAELLERLMQNRLLLQALRLDSIVAHRIRERGVNEDCCVALLVVMSMVSNLYCLGPCEQWPGPIRLRSFDE